MNSNPPSLILNTSIVSAFNLLSRLLGFVRDLLFAYLFGSSYFADAFVVAFRLPNLLRSFVAEGAFSSAFVPVVSSELVKGKDYARRALASISSLLLILTLLLTLLGVFFSREIVTIFAPGFAENKDKFSLCVLLTQIMFPYIIFVSFVAFLNGALNSVQIFGASGRAQVYMNFTLIFGALLSLPFSKQTAIFLFAVSVILGGVVQVVTQIPSLKKAGLSIIPNTSPLSRPSLQVLKLMLPASLGAAIYQVSIFINTIFASVLEEGSISWLYYADRLVQLPLGVFSIALASVLLPALSNAEATKDKPLFYTGLSQALRYTSFIIIPVSVLLYAFAEPLVVVLFQRGEFSNWTGKMTARAIQAYALGLWAVSSYSMMSRAFIAKKDTLTPTIIGGAGLVCNILLSLVFMGNPAHGDSGSISSIIRSTQDLLNIPSWGASLGHVGLALASSATSFITLGIISVMLCKQGGFSLKEITSSTLKTILASFPILLIGGGLLSLDLNWHPILQLLLGIPVSCFSFVIFGYFLKIHELQETFSVFSRIIRAWKKD